MMQIVQLRWFCSLKNCEVRKKKDHDEEIAFHSVKNNIHLKHDNSQKLPDLNEMQGGT